MSYTPGRMGMAEGIALVFTVTLPRSFLTTSSKSIVACGELAWLTPLIASIAAGLILGMLTYVLKRFSGDLLTISNVLLGKVGTWLVGLFYVFVFISDGTLLLRQIAENTLLAALPASNFNYVISWYALFIALTISFGIESIARATYIVLPIGVSGIMLLFLLIIPFIDVYNLLPWKGTGLLEATSRGLGLAGTNVHIMLLMILHPLFQNLRTIQTSAILGLGGSAILRSMSMAIFITVFGKAIAGEKILLFFETARLVYINRYIQHIEAIFIVLWVIWGIIAISINLFLAIYLLTKLLNLETMRPLIPITVFITFQLAMLSPNISNIIELDELFITTLANIGIYGIPSLLFLMTWLKRRELKVCLDA